MAGAGYKLFNTGDVLLASEVNTYLMQQTVMSFADSAARTTALSGVLAEGMVSYLRDTNVVEIYNGSAWASLDDPNAIQNTIVDAKGDLITATGADTPARLAVGSDGDTLVADSAATTGLRYQLVNNGNLVINGSYDFWQRGTSVAQTAGEVFSADRWFSFRDTNATGATISRQTSGVNFTQYGCRVQRDSGNSSTTKIHLCTTFETQSSIGYAGQTITFSFYAKAGANYSGGALTGRLNYGTGTDQRVTAFTGAATVLDVSATLTTSYQRFQGTATVNASATELGILFIWTPTGTAGANDWVEITGVQIEVGSVATTLRKAGGTLQGELAACQRYYQKSYSQATAPATASTTIGSNLYVTVAATAITNRSTIRLPVTMRTTPTVTIYSTNSGTAAKIYVESTAVDVDGVVQNTGEQSFSYYLNSGSLALGYVTLIQYTVSAEL
jgi:hypothetical protein